MDKLIEERFVHKLMEIFQLEEEPVIREVPLSSLGINSIYYIQMVVSMENEFNIEFDDEYLDFTVFQTFPEIINYIEKKMR